jgi:capsular polysaccharide biosynthesis protein/Mrp family chromosome partitioning ATPase
MNLQAAPDYFELSDYTSVLRRRWKTIAAVTLAGVALSVAYLQVAPATYTATVLVQVNALPNNANAVGGRTGGPVNMDNEGQAVRSTAVVDLVKKSLNSPLSVTDLSQKIHVTVPPNSTFLQITCQASSAFGAQKCANAIGRAYLYDRRVGIRKLIGAGLNAQKQEAVTLQGQVQDLKVTLFNNRHKKGNVVVSAIEVLSLKLSQTKLKLAQVNAHIAAALPLYAAMTVHDTTVVGDIASPATLPTTPSSPRKILYLPSGLIAGLVLGVALAFIADRRDKRVHSARDVERFGGMPTLMYLGGKGQRPVTGLESPRSAAGRAFSELAYYVEAGLGEGSHVLAVAATSPGSSAGSVAVNLAAALSRSADQTVLICGDLNGTRVPEILGAGRARGLSEVLTGAARPGDVLFPPADLPRLRVITPGFDVARATSAIQQSAVKHVIDDLRAEAKYVIIEVQSVGENSDTFSLARFADAAIVAVEVGRSRPRDIADCATRLGRLGAKVLGTAILPAGPISRRAKSTASSAAPPAAPQDRSYEGSIRRYEMRQDQAAPTAAPAVPAPTAAPTAEPTAPPSASAPSWTAGTPTVSGSRPDFTPAAATHGIKETMPMPRYMPGEREGYPNSADPATGD